MASTSQEVAAILLTGGASRRMGRDKSELVVDGVTLARRSARVIERVVATAVEVGPGHSGLAATREDPPGSGPLAAVAAGRRWLREAGFVGDALVLAGDLPFFDDALLRFLIEYPTPGTALPVVKGRVQPLLARWGSVDLDEASERFARGERSLRHLSASPHVTLLDETTWRHVATERSFADLDEPDDLRRYGLDW